MKRALIIAMLLGTCVSGAGKKKQFEIGVEETVAQRGDQTISVDARVRNTGDRAIEALILVFDFMAAGNQVITTQQIPVDDEVLEPGKETVVHAKMRDEVRAVRYRVNATDKAGHDMAVRKAGPYVIE
ncbi:MAG: hypothetical protein M1436_09740 [Acidobacteria bacterium]|nr:hypothetical protein [Acidobacteriota bacterium]